MLSSYFLDDLDFWEALSDLADLDLTVDGTFWVAPKDGLDEVEATGSLFLLEDLLELDFLDCCLKYSVPSACSSIWVQVG